MVGKLRIAYLQSFSPHFMQYPFAVLAGRKRVRVSPQVVSHHQV